MLVDFCKLTVVAGVLAFSTVLLRQGWHECILRDLEILAGTVNILEHSNAKVGSASTT